MNKHVLAYGVVGIKYVTAKPATQIQPFKLSSGVHHRDSSAASELNTTDSVFHAQPAPKDILAGVVVSKLQLYCAVLRLFCLQ